MFQTGEEEIQWILLSLLIFRVVSSYTNTVVIMGLFSQEDHPILISTGAPFVLGVSYVASLYVSINSILYSTIKV